MFFVYICNRAPGTLWSQESQLGNSCDMVWKAALCSRHVELMMLYTGKTRRSCGNRMRTALLGNSDTEGKDHLVSSGPSLWKCYIMTLCLNASRRTRDNRTKVNSSTLITVSFGSFGLRLLWKHQQTRHNSWTRSFLINLTYVVMTGGGLSHSLVCEHGKHKPIWRHCYKPGNSRVKHCG